MSVNVKLPPALEAFVRERVETGEFETASDVLLEGVRALQRSHAARAEFTRTLEAAEREAERDGWLPFDDVLSEMEAAVAEVERNESGR
jgi:antitoxin ParD1/3/4